MTTALFSVLSLQAPSAAVSEAPPAGVGMMVGGGILTLGGAAVSFGAVLSFAGDARCHSEQRGECWGGLVGGIMMPFGVLGLAVGVPLLGVGIHRHRLLKRWRAERGFVLRPHLGRARSIWIVGLELRF